MKDASANSVHMNMKVNNEMEKIVATADDLNSASN